LSLQPYVIYGVVKQDGTPVQDQSVTVKNISKNEQYIVQTDNEGEYAVDLGDQTKFPSGYSNGDSITVTCWGVERSGTVDTSTWGERFDFNKLTKLLQENFNLADSMAKTADYYRSLQESLNLQDQKIKSVTATKTETLTLQDSLSRVWTIQRTKTETITFQDSKAAAVSKTKSETLSLSDVISYYKLLHKTLSEGLTLSDSKTFTVSKIESEALSLAETFAKVWTVSRVKTETLSLSDSAAKNVRAVKSESLSLSDSFLKALAKLLTETLTVQDVLAKTWSKHLTRTETLQLQDVFSKTWTIYRIHTENLSLYDLIIRELFIGLIKKTLTETLSLGDSVAKKSGKIQVETLSFADAFSRVWAAHKILTGTLTLQDSLAKTQMLHKVLTDTLTLNDVILRSLIGGLIKKELVETLQLGDVQPVFALSKVLTDTVAFQDSFSRTWVLARVLTDTLVLSDSVSASMWAPIYGVMSLKPLDTDMTLYEILAELDLYFLRQVLQVKEKA